MFQVRTLNINMKWQGLISQKKVRYTKIDVCCHHHLRFEELGKFGISQQANNRWPHYWPIRAATGPLMAHFSRLTGLYVTLEWLSQEF